MYFEGYNVTPPMPVYLLSNKLAIVSIFYTRSAYSFVFISAYIIGYIYADILK